MRTLPIITIETVLARDLCWLDADTKLRALNQKFARTEWTALEVFSLEGVSADDRLWVCLHDSILPGPVLRRFAVEVAADAMRLTNWVDARSWAGLDAALAYERGEIGAAARAAAWAATDAARAAAAAAWAAARAAARAATTDATDAARAAATDAARAAAAAAADAAWAAARAAARAATDAARDAQICMLRQITLLWCDGYDLLAGGPWERKARPA